MSGLGKSLIFGISPQKHSAGNTLNYLLIHHRMPGLGQSPIPVISLGHRWSKIVIITDTINKTGYHTSKLYGTNWNVSIVI